jgi:cytochrome c oxidase subunit I+III
VVSLLVPVFARRPLVAYRWVVVSIIGVGFISFGLWVHHMFAVGIPALSQAFFSMASMLVAVPTGIQLFAWLATLWSGRPVWSVPMLWVAGFLVIFVAGGLTGVMLAFVPFNWQVHDTHFVVAHFHYVLVGGMLFPLIAGLYYWLPHFTGRMPSERLSRAGFWLTFVGFNGTFLIMHWTGLLGMPRRVYTYDAGLGWDLPNLVSSVFSFVMAFGIATLLLDLLLHGRFGRKAPPNPWGADTLEWASGTPPKSYNFASLAPLPTRQPLWDDPGLMERIEQGHYALPSAAHGRRETLGVDPVSGRPREVIHLPGNSWWPLVAAVLLALLCVALLLKSYTPALVLVALALAVLLRWSWENGAHPAAAAGEAHDLPQGLRLHSRTFDGPGLWGMGLTVLANAALFAALLFGWLYLWTLVPGSASSDSLSAQADAPLRSGLLGLAALGLVLGQWLLGRAVRRLRAGEHAGLLLRLWGVAGCCALAFAALLAGWFGAEGQPTLHALDAVQGFTALYLLLHTGLAAVLALLQAERVRRGYVGLFAPYEPAVLLIWWRFTAAAVLLVALVMGLLPWVLGLAP